MSGGWRGRWRVFLSGGPTLSFPTTTPGHDGLKASARRWVGASAWGPVIDPLPPSQGDQRQGAGGDPPRYPSSPGKKCGSRPLRRKGCRPFRKDLTSRKSFPGQKPLRETQGSPRVRPLRCGYTLAVVVPETHGNTLFYQKTGVRVWLRPCSVSTVSLPLSSPGPASGVSLPPRPCVSDTAGGTGGSREPLPRPWESPNDRGDGSGPVATSFSVPDGPRKGDRGGTWETGPAPAQGLLAGRRT